MPTDTSKVTGYRLPNPKWDAELRHCCVCGIEDNPLYSGEADSDGPIFVHRVVIDLCFLEKRELTQRERQQGYMLMDKLEGGRTAKVRMICRDCLNQDEETKSVWDDFKKAQQEVGEESDKSYYEILCME